ncbi:MAG: hypothetical protein KU28_00630 [Sulfurovum sp. PC08-66]|nr:MAG: hypothetical protein KU28_00630 [Sulfurovum sp. PC08-66]KIM12473.1 MAG: hypothetical protein KU37_00745 [Sulfuricurvum sp. PC08-66]
MKKILVCIVIYKKNVFDIDILFLKEYENIISLFVYDNSPIAQSAPEVPNLFYEHDSLNSGVSRAYNQAYKKAKELGVDALLLLDQDSKFSTTMLEKYFLLYEKYGKDYIYAPIVCDENKTKVYSPAYLNHFVGKAQRFNEFGYKELYSLDGKSVINSGLMIPMAAFQKIGGYNEKLKLDFSDVYFIEKYKEINENIVLVDLYLEHTLSGDEGKDFAREYNRFRYYCSASRELGLSLKKKVIWSPIRRLLRLILKYRMLSFIKIFYSYYLKGKEI